MIRYHCDFSGKQISADQVAHCYATVQSYVQANAGVPWVQLVCAEVWHEDYNERITEFWVQKAELLYQIEAEKERRLSNNRKEFFKPKATSKSKAG